LGPPVQHWYLNILISLPIAFGVAFVSWHLVEKHALRFRTQVEQIEAPVLSRISIAAFRRKSPERIELGPALGSRASV
jgi:peptidoglycan/LPS O-acetylase OafA/YrhL